jgi:mannan endo-1,4-beta-mannosidase
MLQARLASSLLSPLQTTGPTMEAWMSTPSILVGNTTMMSVLSESFTRGQLLTSSQFYRLPEVKKAYKRYIKAVVTRYKDNPTIFAWELANEARCGADGVRNLPRSDNCTSELITGWYDEMSTYIKSLDKNHLVTTGSEGGFNIESDDWAYNGADGSDFDAELKLKNIDFGTFHSYPDWWSKTVEWTVQWIKDHGKSMRAAKKPVVHEEYGKL